MQKQGLTIGAITAIVIGILAAIAVASQPGEPAANNTAQNNSQTQTSAMSSSTTATTTTSADTSAEASAPTEGQAGVYTEYSMNKLSADKKNVIFFSANWCPTCNALNRDINGNLGNIPSDVQILKAEYETLPDLERKYGVTYQHTLVQVDENGNLIKKWNGGLRLQDLLSQIV